MTGAALAGGDAGILFAHQNLLGGRYDRRLQDDQHAHPVLHGDDDQVVPFADSAALAVKRVKAARPVRMEGGPYGTCTTLKDRVNRELLGFIKG